MRLMETIKKAVMAFFCLAIAMAMTSCGNDGRNCDNALSLNADKDRKESDLSCAKIYEKEFRRVIDDDKRSVRFVSKDVSRICSEVCQLPQSEALSLLERFQDMAIMAKPPSVDDSKPSWYRYEARRMWFERMHYVFCEPFYASLRLRMNPFDDWKKLFVFFGKYTEEIAEVEKTLSKTSAIGRGVSDGAKGRYLRNLKEELEVKIRFLRNRCPPLRDDEIMGVFKQRPTDDQKAELRRRFDKILEYTARPPGFQGGGKEAQIQ